MTNSTGSWTATGTAAPTNYTDRADSNTTDNNTVGQTEIAVAFRQLNASSEDVGTHGLVDVSNARNSALVIAVRPAPAGVAADLTQTQAADTISAAATIPITASASTTEAVDTISAAATIPITADLAQTEAADTPASAGTVADPGITGSEAIFTLPPISSLL